MKLSPQTHPAMLSRIVKGRSDMKTDPNGTTP
jgi:hypothetical protein